MELMTVTAIIGILSMMAVPVFRRYMARARSTEAVMNLRHMYDASVAYFAQESVGRGGQLRARAFPRSEALTPGEWCVTGEKLPVRDSDWNSQTWQSLSFMPTRPFYYNYEYESDGEYAEASFSARAVGDLDCDTVKSTFERMGRADSVSNVAGSGWVWTRNEVE